MERKAGIHVNWKHVVWKSYVWMQKHNNSLCIYASKNVAGDTLHPEPHIKYVGFQKVWLFPIVSCKGTFMHCHHAEHLHVVMGVTAWCINESVEHHVDDGKMFAAYSWEFSSPVHTVQNLSSPLESRTNCQKLPTYHWSVAQWQPHMIIMEGQYVLLISLET